MTTKLKIDLSQGLLEVEGSETFVKSIYSDFKTHFAGIDLEEPEKSTKRTRRTKSSAKKTTAQTSVPAAAPTGEPAPPLEEPVVKPAPPSPPAYTYLDDLNLGASKNRPSLVEFTDAKFPITNEERNIVFLYYLQFILKLDTVTPDHIYTCYRAVRIRAPNNIQNSFDRRGWIDSSDGTLSLTEAGKDYVEKQLPKRVKN